MMLGELAKSYAPAEAEAEVRAKWEASDAFHARPEGDLKPYCIVIPPPNVTAPLHLGHALNNTLQDVLIRYHRMRGCNTLWMPGTDHAGIATQTVVEKRLLQQGKKRVDLGRARFVATVQQWKDQYEATIIEQLKAMGCSCDWDRTRFTMDEMCANAVREAFFRLFKDGLIYRGKRLVNWDPVTLTALADDEVEMREVQGHMWYLRYPLAPPASPAQPASAGGVRAGVEYITVATTRPETMLGDTAVAMNPKDPRAVHLVGKQVRLPIVNRIIPIIADEHVVMPSDPDNPMAEYATGFLKVTPAHDPKDWDIGQRHDLPVINVLAPDATISTDHGWDDCSDEAQPLVGLARDEARQWIVQWFKDHDLLDDVRDYQHSVGHSYRSHVPIEPYLSDQWYVKVTDDRMTGEALRALSDEQYEGPKPSRSQAGGMHGRDARATGEGALPVPGGAGIKPQFSGTGILPVRRVVTEQLSIRRRNLPHWQIGGSTYFITFRTAKGDLDQTERQLIMDACLHWHGERWHVHLVTIMPDHVHLIVTPLRKDKETWHSLSDLLHSVKSFSANQISSHRGASGIIWQDEYFDRIIRNDDEFYEKFNYMIQNPVKAGLVESAEKYSFTYRPVDDLGPHGRDARATDGNGDAMHRQDACATESSGQEGDSELKFFPARYAKTFQAWHENLRDWCISRQLWWGHRIPVWTLRWSNEPLSSSDRPGSTNVRLGESDQQIQQRAAAEQAAAAKIAIEDFVRAAGIAGDIAVHSENDSWGVVRLCSRSVRADRILDALTDGWEELLRRLREHTHVTDPISDQLSKCQKEALLLARRFECITQDPDVLDTWFSSALWPISTMGWPEPKDYPETIGLLETFNPSSVLTTGRDIITLWVSRMVMFNRYFRNGTLPFRHVYIHPMIQDGHGQRMSKSLGNGVDPRDIIHTHGADALRYIFVQMATTTQDVRLPVDMLCPHCEHAFRPTQTKTPTGHRVSVPEPQCPNCSRKMVSAYGITSGLASPTDDTPLARTASQKFDLGRNFANKLWNAARFALGQMNGGTSGDVRLSELSLVDRWILARLYRIVRKIEAALAEYQFNVYADAMYEFIWGDFCDWYLEAIKPTVKDSSAQQQVLRTVLNAILRILHPICPFVTESLWPHVQATGDASLEGICLAPSEMLAEAAWPEIDAAVDDVHALADFSSLQALVESIRNIRGEHNVPPQKHIRLFATPATSALIDRADRTVSALAGLSSVQTINHRPPDALAFTFDGEEQALADVIEKVDAELERDRLKRQITDLQKRREGLVNRLANPGYTDKAPAHLVDETRTQLATVEADLAAAAKAVEAL